MSSKPFFSPAEIQRILDAVLTGAQSRPGFHGINRDPVSVLMEEFARELALVQAPASLLEDLVTNPASLLLQEQQQVVQAAMLGALGIPADRLGVPEPPRPQVTPERTVNALLKRPSLAFEVAALLLPKVLGPWTAVSPTHQRRVDAKGQIMGYVKTREKEPRGDELPFWYGVVYPDLRGPPPHKTETGNTSEMFLSEALAWVDARLTADGYVLG